MKKLLVLMLLSVASAAYGEVYTWKGALGTVYYTNSLYEIPARYRSRAKVLDVATGKKSPLSTAQTGGQAAPAGLPGQPPPAQPPLAQQVPVQGAPPAGPAPAIPAVAPPAPPPAPPAATAPDPLRQSSRAQRRAQSRQNRNRSGEE